MAAIIADTACVDPRAEIGDEVEVGPYCLIGAGARLGRGTVLAGHVHVAGGVVLGERNRVRAFAVLGAEGDDEELSGGLRIGSGNTVAEGVTISRGRSARGAGTRVGDGAVVRASAHVGPDAALGDRTSIGPGSVIGPSALVDDDAVLAAGVFVRSMATVGRRSFVAGRSRVDHDVPPFMFVDGLPAKVRCLHVVGLRRAGLGREAIAALHEAHRLLFRARMDPRQAAEILRVHGQCTGEVRHLLDALAAQAGGRHRRARDRGGVQMQGDAEPYAADAASDE